MTAEKYLNEHCKPEDWNNLEECLKDSILTNNVIEHMERYAALRIQSVVERSEQLNAFVTEVSKGFDDSHKHKVVKKANDILKSL